MAYALLYLAEAIRARRPEFQGALRWLPLIGAVLAAAASIGRPVAFGGRILPGSPLARQPKYYNSAETPLFSKGEQLYGLDVARSPGAMTGRLFLFQIPRARRPAPGRPPPAGGWGG